MDQRRGHVNGAKSRKQSLETAHTTIGGRSQNVTAAVQFPVAKSPPNACLPKENSNQQPKLILRQRATAPHST